MSATLTPDEPLPAPLELSQALEDYLETIYQLIRSRKVARVKDIAQARNVRSASVSPAMRRLSDLGLIRYVQREYIDLTPAGEREARRVLARHNLLMRFFKDVLKMESTSAEADACAMEHSLSNEGMDHLVRFFEFMQNCPEGQVFYERLGNCASFNQNLIDCVGTCPRRLGTNQSEESSVSIAEMTPGQHGRVRSVGGSGAIRQRLLDMGILPNEILRFERVAPTGDPVWIHLQGGELSLRKQEAATVKVEIL